MSIISRREFARRALAASGALAFAPLEFQPRAAEAFRPSTSPRKRVVILGAGLSGLACAHELSAGGHDVVLLEARHRPGGRVFSLREPFPDGLYAEVGATRISDLHDWVLKYVSRFGLTLDPFRPQTGADVVHVRGKRIVVTDERKVDWPLALTPDERSLGLAGMRARYISPALDQVADAGAPEAPSQALGRFDADSYSAFLKRQGASPDAILLMTLGSGSNENAVTSALMRLRAGVWRGRTQRWSKIRGGNDQLAKAFAAGLSDRIHYRTIVTRVEHSDTGVRVVAVRNGSAETFEGDYVVSTIPLPVLRGVAIAPSLPPEVQRVIREFGYGSATKIFLQTRSRFWDAEGLSGFAVTDGPSQEIWNMSAAQPGRRGLLIVFTTGTTVRDLVGPKDADRVAWAAGEAERLFPGLRDSLENATSYSWDDDPWAGAAFPQPRPGQAIEFLSILRKPVGRIVFAGDHASAWPAWMQGALESGNHAARLIDAAP